MSTYDKFADKYSKEMGESGDFYHKKYIDPAIYEIIGNPKGKRVFDIGCGNGYMARHFTKKGAEVYASDTSSKLIEIAEEKSKDLDIKYLTRDAADFSSLKREIFDVVVMSMVIHYIEDLNTLFKGISRVLKRNGIFVFSTNHFFRPEHPYSEWVEGNIEGEGKLFIKVTNYLKTYNTSRTSWWDNKTLLHFINRPLGSYINGLSKHSLYTYTIREPETPEFPVSFETEFRGTDHIPTFMIIGTKKVSD